MNIDELEKLARSATPGPWKWDSKPCDYDPLDEAPWIVTKDGDPVLRGVIQCDLEADADYVIAANPAAILGLIGINRELVAALKEADDQLVLWQGEPNEFSCAIHYVVMGNIRKALARANGESNE